MNILSEGDLPPRERTNIEYKPTRRETDGIFAPAYEKPTPTPAWGNALYYVPTIRPGKYMFKGFGDIDLRTLDLQEAHELHQKGFEFLCKK